MTDTQCGDPASQRQAHLISKPRLSLDHEMMVGAQLSRLTACIVIRGDLRMSQNAANPNMDNDVCDESRKTNRRYAAARTQMRGHSVSQVEKQNPGIPIH